MKYAEEIAKEIEERGPIDTTGGMVDKNDAWEDYIRRTGHVPREKRKPCISYEDGCDEWAGCPCVYYKTESEAKMIKILLVKEHILYLLYKLFSNICHILASKHHETYVKIYKIYEYEDKR